MNSEQFCKTSEWQDYKNQKWSLLYKIENAYNYIEWDGEWIDGEPSFKSYEYPHPKESGNVIVCAYCGWYGMGNGDTYFVFEHILPISKYPNLRLDDSNIVLACNKCNKDKGNKVLHKSLSDIIKEYQRAALGGNVKQVKI